MVVLDLVAEHRHAPRRKHFIVSVDRTAADENELLFSIAVEAEAIKRTNLGNLTEAERWATPKMDSYMNH